MIEGIYKVTEETTKLPDEEGNLEDYRLSQVNIKEREDGRYNARHFDESGEEVVKKLIVDEEDVKRAKGDWLEKIE